MLACSRYLTFLFLYSFIIYQLPFYFFAFEFVWLYGKLVLVMIVFRERDFLESLFLIADTEEISSLSEDRLCLDH